MKRQNSQDSQVVQRQQSLLIGRRAKVPSSPYQQYYSERMNLMNPEQEEFLCLLSTLQQNGFEYSQNFSFSFTKKIIKNSKDSIKYEIQYGNFKTFIYSVFWHNEFKQIQREKIDQGNFGKIFLFNYKQKQIVAKLISMDKNHIQNILKQIFWVKFASALKIGPKFIKAYCYDCIFYRDTCQYLMQRCLIDVQVQQNINQKFFPKRLKSIIQILHSFKAIHGDIKPNHVAWSQKQKNIVLIDFGMARFIEEQIGQMTLTQYFGTYTYSCKQMKKAYLLKSEYLVDLFNNDLYGLEQCEKVTSKQYLLVFKKKFKNYANNWALVVNLFEFKYYLFQQNQKEVIRILQTQKQMIKCFRQLTKYEKQNLNNTFATYLWAYIEKELMPNIKCILQSSQCTEQYEIIYREILKCYNMPAFFQFQISEPFIKKMYEDEKLELFLQQNESMQALFEFIFEPKRLSEAEISSKKHIIQYIFLTKKLSQSASSSEMTHFILLFFQDYFKKVGNLQKLSAISFLFWVAHENESYLKIQHDICEVFLKNVDTLVDYYKDSIAYLFNFSSMIRKKWIWFSIQHQARNKFLQQKNQQFIQSCAIIIKGIQKITSLVYLNLPYEIDQFNQLLISFADLFFQQQKITSIQDFNNDKDKWHKIISAVQQKDWNRIYQDKILVKACIQWQQQQVYEQFQSTLLSFNYMLRDTVWNLVCYAKNKRIQDFEKSLQFFSSSVFVANTYEGIANFYLFCNIISAVGQNSSKVQQFMKQFIANIDMKKLLNQLTDSAVFLRALLFSYFGIIRIFFQGKLLQNEVDRNINRSYKQIKYFIQQNLNQWWAVKQSEVIMVFQTIKIYLQAKQQQNSSQLVHKMINIALTIVQYNYSIQLFDIVIGSMSQLFVNSKFKNKNNFFHQIWKIFEKFTNRELLFYILSRNMAIFQGIIHKLCQNQQFEQCLQILEEYGMRLAQKKQNYLNTSSHAIFLLFVQLIPERLAQKLFRQRLNEFSLQRIGQSYRLSFIFLFLLQKNLLPLSSSQKNRYYNLISFGLSKMKIRYANFIQINSFLLHFHRSLTQFLNSRHQRLHLKKQIRAFYKQKLHTKLMMKKEKQCRKISSKWEALKQFIIKKIIRKI